MTQILYFYIKEIELLNFPIKLIKLCVGLIKSIEQTQLVLLISILISLTIKFANVII